MSHYRRYPAYKESGVEWIGEVPEHWEVKRLEHVVSTHRENVAADALNPLNVLHYSIPAVQETGGGSVEAGSTIDSNKLVVRCPQVLISKLNPRKGTVVVAAPDPELPTVASTEFVPLVPRRGRSVIPFIAAVVVSEPLRQLLESRVESVTRSHQRVAPEDILKACLAVPPIEEQAAIAAALDRETARIDALIAKKVRFIELLKEKRQALITRAVTKGLDPTVKMKDSGVAWIGEVPAHWAVSRLGHFAKIENGTTPSRTNDAYWTGGNIAWLGSGEVNQGFVTEATEYITAQALRECSLRLLPVGTVIVGMIGQGRTRGLTAILGIEATINQNLAAVSAGMMLRGEYIQNVFAASYEWLREGGRGSNQAALNCELLGEFRMVLPPLVEQDEILARISNRTSRIDALTRTTERSITLLKERRAALITAAVTGQIDLRKESA